MELITIDYITKMIANSDEPAYKLLPKIGIYESYKQARKRNQKYFSLKVSRRIYEYLNIEA